MKIVIILASLCFFSCNGSRAVHMDAVHQPEFSSMGKKAATYQVYKIDSINHFYLVYAKKQDSLFKIVSQKESVQNCNRIRQGGVYEFILRSRSEDRHVGGKEILPQNSLLVTCFYYDDSTKICLERDSINDLHYAENLRGLCLMPK